MAQPQQGRAFRALLFFRLKMHFLEKTHIHPHTKHNSREQAHVIPAWKKKILNSVLILVKSFFSCKFIRLERVDYETSGGNHMKLNYNLLEKITLYINLFSYANTRKAEL